MGTMIGGVRALFIWCISGAEDIDGWTAMRMALRARASTVLTKARKGEVSDDRRTGLTPFPSRYAERRERGRVLNRERSESLADDTQSILFSGVISYINSRR
jgi:hypothetical protein